VAHALLRAASPLLATHGSNKNSATVCGPVREHLPHELTEALRAAGFEVQCLFTKNAPGYHSQEWVLEILRELKYPTQLRGEQMYCVAQKFLALRLSGIQGSSMKAVRSMAG
jgi:hypothetical protein